MPPTSCPTTCRALLTDSDVALTQELCEFLECRSYTVSLAHSGFQAKRLLAQGNFDIALFATRLPDIDGLDLLRYHRACSTQPVIMLTAQDSEIERVQSLEWGAEDCIAKPFSLRELQARMQAIRRRTQSTEAQASPRWLTAGALSLDPTTGRTVFGNHEISLTGAEQRVLEVLMRSVGDIVTRQEIGQNALGRLPGPYDRSIDTHISCLRKKLQLGTHDASIVIRNLRGLGYVLACR